MPQYINEEIAGQDDDSEVIDWPGGPGAFAAEGTWGNISLTLKFQIDGSQWVAVKNRQGNDLTLTTDGMGTFAIFPCKLQVQGTGGSFSTTIKVRVAPTWQGWFNEAALL